LTGRCIVKHMAGKINETIAGDYNHTGVSIIYGDTDSVDAESIIRTNLGDKTVEDLFLSGSLFWQEGNKEYSRNDAVQVVSYLPEENKTTLSKYNYVYRHKVRKKKYRITTSSGKSVIVTEDHSVMVLIDGQLVEKKPTQLTKNDKVITLS